MSHHQHCCVRFLIIVHITIIISTVLLIRFGRKTICLAACLAITIFGSFTSLSSSMPVWDADYADRYSDYDDRDADYADFGDGDAYEDDYEW